MSNQSQKAIWEAEQVILQKQVNLLDRRKFEEIRWVAGVDISFDPADPDHICAYLTIMDAKSPNQTPIYETYLIDHIKIPYESGFLGFREVPYYLRLFQTLRKDHPELWPDVIMVDGFGILHHRGLGSASHLGILLKTPTIGVAKTLLNLDGLNEKSIKTQFATQCVTAGDSIPLMGSTQVYGVAYKSTKEAKNPIYITPGHQITLASAIKVVGLFCQYRIPEPIRNSDIKSKLHF
jgi:deoxyinosine 3'endonuclease (endonuclease V)